MLLSELLGAVSEKKVENYEDVEVSDLAYDSRLVEPWGAFFCIKGLVTDGHMFAAEAEARGARVVFAEREVEPKVGPDVVVVTVPDSRFALAQCADIFFGQPTRHLKLVGVTGTNGKTTTTFLVENIVRMQGKRSGLIGTVENHIVDVVESVTRTTPESLDLQRLFRRMVDEGVEVAVMEVSSHALELKRADGCNFEVVAFTNLTQDHLDFHISLEEYFGAKRRLFADNEFGPGRVAVVNVDDPFGVRLSEETKLPTRSFAIDRDADTRATRVSVSPEGNSFTLERGGESIPLKTRLQGRFNVYNCLAAAGIAFELGAGPESIAGGLENLEGVPGRFENIDCGQDFTVVVDYAHTTDGIRNVLEACREVTRGRVILVVGCGGDRDRSKRPLMGGVGAKMADFCIVTSDNPRSEDPNAIIEMILEGVRGQVADERFTVEADRRKAIYRAVEEARPGDLVVIAGKGHESGQIFSDSVIPFDDRKVAREALKEVRGAQC